MFTNFTKTFSESEKLAVWNKGGVDSQYDSNMWRFDKCGAWMKFSDYGNRNSKYGWEIDHIVPTSKNGSDDISNLQPLRWENNAAKSDGQLVCAVGTGKF
ncbi:MAG: HNH endonuclease signature motif containing protein [Candidatus Gracilibacteria bacterium]|nr:HNH endonuclease signature motif containing protein [Candidatus Gracilibacteria bacterium]